MLVDPTGKGLRDSARANFVGRADRRAARRVLPVATYERFNKKKKKNWRRGPHIRSKRDSCVDPARTASKTPTVPRRETAVILQLRPDEKPPDLRDFHEGVVSPKKCERSCFRGVSCFCDGL